MSHPDPGGAGSGGGSSKGPPDLNNLQDNFNQQQAKITALKELVRQTEATQGRKNASAQEKVKNIAKCLSHLKRTTASAKGRRGDKSLSEVHEEHPPDVASHPDGGASDASVVDHRSGSVPVGLNRTRSETPGSEKIQLLRKQMEQNRAKMAEREHSKRDIEQMVTQLKAKFDSSQMSLDRSHQLGRSIGDLSASSSPHAHKYQSAADLSNPGQNFDKDRIRYLEKRLGEMENELKNKEAEFLARDAHQENVERVQELEHSVFDLQEQIREKDSIIEARTQAVGLVSETMSKKGKNTVDLLEDTQQEMVNMQQNFVDVEEALRAEIEMKSSRIANLEEVNDILEKSRYELTVKLAQLENPDNVNKMEELQHLNDTLHREINDLRRVDIDSRSSDDETGKKSESESLVSELQQQITELNAQIHVFETDKLSLQSPQDSKNQIETELQEKIDKMSSEIDALKTENDDLKRSTQSQEISSELNQQIAQLSAQITALETENDDLKRSLQSPIEPITNIDLTDHIRSLEAELAEQRTHNQTLTATIETLEGELQEKTTELNVLSANFSVLQEKLKSSAPKSLFSVSTDEEAGAEVAKLKTQLDEANKSAIKTKLRTKQLQKQIDALKKSSDLAANVCQLTQDNEKLRQRIQELEDIAANATSTPSDTELGVRIQVLETTCHNHLSAIQLLEEQKIDISHDLNSTKEELHSLQDQCKSVEAIVETASPKKDTTTSNLDSDIVAQLQAEIAALQNERTSLMQKLDENVTQNMELLDRCDKLNKNSSAESIEIVEKLTPQETLEMEEMQRAVETSRGKPRHASVSDDSCLVQLREESSELKQKLEMISNERREVLEKMDSLAAENQKLQSDVDRIEHEKAELEKINDEMILLKNQLDKSEEERLELIASIKELKATKMELREELNLATKSHADATSVEPIEYQREPYDKSMKTLENLLESYRRGKDKNAKFDVSKKLAKEAKNFVDQMNLLLTEHDQMVERYNALRVDAAKSLEFESLKAVSRNERIEAELVDATNSLQTMETQCAEYKAEITRLIQENAELAKSEELKTEEFNRKSEEIINKSQAISDKSDEFNQSIATLEAEIESLKITIEENALERDHLRTESDAQTRRIETYAQEHSHNEGEIRKLRNEIERITQQFGEKFNKQNHDFAERSESAEKEREILKTLVMEQKNQLIDTITEYQDELDQKTTEIEELERKLAETTKVSSNNNQGPYIEELKHKMIALQQLFEDNNDQLERQSSELQNKQDTITTLNQQIMELYRSAEEHSTKMLEKDDELNYLQEIIDGNRKEAEPLHRKIKELEANIVRLESELGEKLQTIELLKQKQQQKSLGTDEEHQQKLTDLQKHVTDLEEKNKELLDKLKKFAANLKKKNTQCTEQTEQITLLNEQINSFKVEIKSLSELQSNNQSNNEDRAEIETLRQECNRKTSAFEELQQNFVQIQEKLVVSERNVAQLNEKIQLAERDQLKLTETLQQTSANAEKLIDVAHERDSLTSKNQHLTDKLEDLEQDLQTAESRNLELITRTQELEISCTNLNAKLSHSGQTMDDLVKSMEQRSAELDSLRQELNTQNEKLTSQNLKIEKCKVIIRDKNRELARLNETIAELQERENQLKENSGNRDECLALQRQLESLRQQDLQHQLKLEEHVNYIESLQTETNALKDKIAAFEEQNRATQTQRDELEQDLAETRDRLSANDIEFKRNQEELQTELLGLSKNLQDSQQRLKEADAHRQELQDKLQEANEAVTIATQKYHNLESSVSELESQLHQCQEDKSILTRDNAQLQADLKRELSEFENKLAVKREEVDTLENDLTVQLQRIENERRRLHESLEKTIDENGELQSDIVRFKEIITSLEQSNSDLEREMTWIKMQNEGLLQDQVEVQELRMQIVHDQTELENLKAQAQTLAANHDTEVSTLKQQLAELDSLRTQIGQNQTDDQMFIQNENERLQALLASKEAEIQNYQRQNLQLQMAGTFAVAATAAPTRPDPFAAFTSSQSTPAVVYDDFVGVGAVAQVTSSDSEKLQRIQDLESRLQQSQMELQQIKAHHEDYLRKSTAEQKRSDDHHAQQMTNVQTEIALLRSQFEEDLARKVNEIRQLQDRMESTSSNVQQQQPVREETVQQTKSVKVESQSRQSETTDVASGTGTSLSSGSNAEDIEKTLQLNSQMTQYINDLQIQLRIAVNDNEQLTQMHQSLEDEIQQRSRNYEQELEALRGELKEIKQQLQQKQSEGVSAAVESLVSSQIIPTVHGGIPSKHQANQYPNPNAESDPLDSILSQIIPTERAVDSSAVPSFDGAMFFGQTTPSSFDFPIAAKASTSEVDSQQEVVEEMIVPKKAYQCTEDDPPIADDGWGFGSDDAALEEQHHQQTIPINASASLLTAEGTLRLQLQEQEDRIEELTLERDRLRTEMQAMQVKSGKMLKKLKEYKTKIDETAAIQQQRHQNTPKLESNDLDLAIQQELNAQIQTLEARLATVKSEQDKDSAEKQSLLKRIDVLTSANERLTDIKEHHDTEMESCKLQIRQLNQKLAHLEEWGDDSESHTTTTTTKTTTSDTTTASAASRQELDDLNRIISDLRVDNDELQACLEEEKANSNKLEEKLNKLQDSQQHDSNQLEDSHKLYEALQAEKSAAISQLSQLQEESAQLTADIQQKNQQIQEQEQRIAQMVARMNESVATIDTLSVESNNIRLHLEQLKLDHQVKIDENASLSQQLKAFSDHIKEMQNSMRDVPRSTDYNASPDVTLALEKQVEELQATLQCKESEIVHLNQTVEDVVRQDQTASLVNEILAKNTEIQTLRTQITEMREQIVELQNNISLQLTKEMAATTKVESQSPSADHIRHQQLEHEINELRADNHNMEQELQVLNDQVMKSIHLEDDFEALRMEMARKNIEIAELRTTLATQSDDHDHHEPNIEAITQQLNEHWQKVLDERCAEVAESWRQHLHNELEAIQNNQQQLGADHPKNKTSEVDSDVAEAQLESMQAVLESQEMEIVSLKEQLAIRSAEYARIAAQVDPYGQMATRGSLLQHQQQQPKRDSAADVRTNQKSELDLALYMLHQRDMRCEELTEELMRMLEERDSLQMKLSTTIRQLERQRLASSGNALEGDLESTDAASTEKLAAETASNQSNSDISSIGDTFQTPSTTRTKALRDEREQRQRQMALLQRDVATLPPEAVAELMGPDYYNATTTSGRSVVESSPSSTLLNWFWGKATEDR